MLAEAVTQFQALAYKELLPAGGPVRTQIIGVATPDKEAQSQRVKEFMNYQIMSEMKEYEPEFDQMRSEERRVGKECRSRWWP